MTRQELASQYRSLVEQMAVVLAAQYGLENVGDDEFSLLATDVAGAVDDLIDRD